MRQTCAKSSRPSCPVSRIRPKPGFGAVLTPQYPIAASALSIVRAVARVKSALT